MILISDCGGTKCTWIEIDGDKAVNTVVTDGINAVQTPDDIKEKIISTQLVPGLKCHNFDYIYYYGAGCIDDNTCNSIRESISRHIRFSAIEISSDLVAAARALCGSRPGIACILGTGSNSCLYDGKKIIANVPPLGYILGDEGSGAVMGKLFLGNMFKGIFPEHIKEKFVKKYDFTYPEIINRVYRQPQANFFMASFMPFIKENLGEATVREMIIYEFRNFVCRNVARYEGYETLPVNFTGSVAVHFKAELVEALNLENCKLGIIAPDPIELLTKYHIDNTL